MLNQPIAILGHWHTGSSCLAKTLEACGMHTGNKETLWDDNSLPNCEHAQFNDIGIRIYHDMQDPEELIPKARLILRKYREQAEIHGWKFYGIKSTHVLQEKCWKYFKPVFKEEWPDAKYIIPVRAVVDIIKSTTNPGWDKHRIRESTKSTVDAIHSLVNDDARVIVFPEDFQSGHVRKIIESLGMTWNNKADSVFDIKRVKNISTDVLN